MFWTRFQICRVFGFPIYVDISWFVIALLVTWSLATAAFPQWTPDQETVTYWIMGVCGALGLFVSILAHELGHALAARKYGVEMRGITLFIFGGVAEMAEDTPSAEAEFVVAVAGPIVSVVLGLAFLGLAIVGSAMNLSGAVLGVVGWLGVINLVLVAFNMIPAFPLDGGRVLRALLWYWTESLRRATRITSAIGGAFGMALIILGVLVLITGQFVSGIWFILIGLFLRFAAQQSYQQVIVRRALQGEPIRRFMTTEPVTVDPNLSIEELVERYIYRVHHKMYPVVDSDGRVVGCITTRQVSEVPREQWSASRVADVMVPVADENTIHPDADAMQAMTRLNQSGQSRLMVVDGDRVVGVLSLKDLMTFLSLKVELEEDASSSLVQR